MEGKFLGREPFDKPSCPFCGAFIEKPRDLFLRKPVEMPVGRCSCGGVYACDVTGHSLGSAMIEALVVSCNGDWDLAFDLIPDEDYVEKEVENYDLETHLIIHSGAYEGRHVHGVLYFIRLHEDVREVTEEGTRRLLEKALPVSKERPMKRRGKNFSKRQVEAFVEDYRMDALVELAGQDKRILRDIQRLLYSADPLIRCRAAEAMGRTSSVIARKDPAIISRLLQGLFTSISDTAASSWGYIGAIGEIIHHNPDQFLGYVPELYGFMRDRALLPEVLDALGKIAQNKPEALRKKAYYFIPLLQDEVPQIRAYAIMLLGHLHTREARDDLLNLLEDRTPVVLYRNGRLHEDLTVGQLAGEALDRMEVKRN